MAGAAGGVEARQGGQARQDGQGRQDGQKGGGDEEQQAEAAERRSVSAEVVHDAVLIEGDEELDRSSPALAWSGLAAGLAMGFSMVGQGYLREMLPAAPWRPLVESLGYTLGFLFVVMGRQQLFTENTLTAVLPVLEERSKLRNMGRLWGVVLAANLAGALLFALVAGHTTVFAPETRAAFAEIGREALEPGFWTLLVRAVFAGWLIALMVWLLPGAEHARFAMIVVPTYLVALAHFPHSIASSVDVLFVVTTGQAPWAEYGRFVAAALLGNVLGGVTLVAGLNHLQVVAGTRRSDKGQKRPEQE